MNDHYHVLLDCKNTYINKLVNIVTPNIKLTLDSLYDEAKQQANVNKKTNLILKYFQEKIKSIVHWNNSKITEEVSTLCSSNNITWLDELIKAIFIANYKIINIIHTSDNTIDINIDIPNTKLFIHTMYINISRKIWLNPFLMYHNCNYKELNQNKIKLDILIKETISDTIEDFLPIQDTLEKISKTIKVHLKHDTDTLNNQLRLESEIQSEQDNILKQRQINKQKQKSEEEQTLVSLLKQKREEDEETHEQEQEHVSLIIEKCEEQEQVRGDMLVENEQSDDTHIVVLETNQPKKNEQTALIKTIDVMKEAEENTMATLVVLKQEQEKDTEQSIPLTPSSRTIDGTQPTTHIDKQSSNIIDQLQSNIHSIENTIQSDNLHSCIDNAMNVVTESTISADHVLEEIENLTTALQDKDKEDMKTVILGKNNGNYVDDSNLNICKTDIFDISEEDSDVSDDDAIFFNDAKMF